MADRPDIAADFNATAKRFLDQEVSTPLLLAKYGLMLKFQAESLDDKSAIAAIMCDTALEALNQRAAPGYRGWLGSSDVDSIAAVLKALESPDSAPLLRNSAPKALADTGMKFIQRAETTHDTTDRNKFTDYARLCLDHAEKFQAIIDRRSDDVSTSKNITPARRIVLKKDGDGPGI